MKKLALALLLLSSCATGGQVTAVSKERVDWKPAANLPAGMMTALEWGDLEKGPYQVLIKFPAGVTVQPHYHKYDEFATIASGTIVFGQGEVHAGRDRRPLRARTARADAAQAR